VLINDDVVGFLNVVWESNDGDLVNICKPCKNALAHVKKFIHEYFKSIIDWLLGYKNSKNDVFSFQMDRSSWENSLF